MEDKIMNVMSAYAPQQGSSQEEKNEVIGADFNGHVGQSNNGYEACHGGFGYGCRNSEGETLLSFCTQYNLTIMNTFYAKKEKHLITYSSGGANTQIDYILCDNSMRNMMRDCKVILGEELVSQHRLLISEFVVRKVTRMAQKNVREEKITWYKLPETPDLIIILQEYVNDIIEASDDLDINELWNAFQDGCILKARELLGITKGCLNIKKETWWWNQSVSKAVQEKKEAFKR